MKSKLIVLAIAASLPMAALAQTAPKSPGGAPESQTPPGSNQPGSPPSTKQFGGKASGSVRLDTNSDGYVSREEAKASAEISKRFNDLDKDGDGKLSTKELGTSAGGSGSSSKEPKTRY